MALKIAVVPIGDGWAVRTAGLDNEMLFRAGAKAEAAARDLARRSAAAGRPAEVTIFLRDGEVAGRFVHAPTKPAGAVPA